MKTLTRRQSVVTQLAAQGMTCAQIAEAAGVAVNTARATLQQARERVGAKNVTHLVAIAIKHGWINFVFVVLIGSMVIPQDDAMRRHSAKRQVRRTEETAIVI